jgi:hypothetical protein
MFTVSYKIRDLGVMMNWKPGVEVEITVSADLARKLEKMWAAEEAKMKSWIDTDLWGKTT